MENSLPDLDERQPGAAAPAEENIKLRQVLLELLETILMAVALFLAINAVSARVRVDGFSMRPTLQNGEYVLVNRLAYRWHAPQRGDIIVFQYPFNTEDEYIKRIIGLPGDEIMIHDGQVWVNETRLQENYIAAAPNYNGEWHVPDGHLFVLGDNRNDSSDSHVWGTLDMQYVIGKALVIYWPYQDFQILHHPQLIPTP